MSQNKLYDLCYAQIESGVRESLNDETYEKSEKLIEDCIDYVMHNISIQYSDKDNFLRVVNDVSKNVVNTIVIFIQQLVAFKKGNQGPFLDMCEEVLRADKYDKLIGEAEAAEFLKEHGF